MKKVLIATGILLVIVGVVIVAVFGGSEGVKDFAGIVANHQLSNATVQENVSIKAQSNARRIIVETEEYSVYLIRSEGDNIVVRHPELNDNVQIYLSETKLDSDFVIRVTQRRTNHFYYNMFSSFIVIELPRNLNIDVDISVDAGKISVSDLSFANLVCKNSAGSINIENVTAQEITASNEAGAIHLEKVVCDNLKATTSAGANKVTNVTVKNRAIMSADAGAATFQGSAGRLDISTSAGKVYFDITSDTISAKSSLGKIAGVVHGEKSDYDIQVEHNMGSCNLSNQSANKGKLLKVESDMGAVKIDFSNN